MAFCCSLYVYLSIILFVRICLVVSYCLVLNLLSDKKVCTSLVLVIV
ncbi:hypothetical protein Hanom_Chr10g00957331 [Helianthus anomalus]